MSERDERMPELSTDASAAWAAFAGSLGPDDGAQARVLQRVRARASRRVATEDIGDDEPRGSQGARRAAAAVLVVKSSAISVGLAGGALLSIKLIVAAVHPPTAPPAPVATTAPVVVSAPAVPAPPPPSRPTATPSEPPAAVAVPAAPPVQSPAKPRRVGAAATTATATDALQAEIDLIERVRAAVRANEYARALELVDAHRTGFPAGALVEERLAFHAICACKLGRADASERARGFAKSYPKSVQLAAVRAACDVVAIDAMDPETQQQ